MKNWEFTLIELLIVVAIISILAGMLLPALQKSREVARQTICAGNTKQVALSFNSYIDDNSGWIYPAYNSSANLTWTSVIKNEGYLKWDRKILVCPTLIPEADKMPTPVPFATGLNLYSFSYNTWIKNTEIRNPSQLLFMSQDIGRKIPPGDAICSNSYMYYVMADNYLSSIDYYRLRYHHFKNCNALFFDNHVDHKKIWPAAYNDSFWKYNY